MAGTEGAGTGKAGVFCKYKRQSSWTALPQLLESIRQEYKYSQTFTSLLYLPGTEPTYLEQDGLAEPRAGLTSIETGSAPD